jgi:capsular exopolysaccharide synthesis family protein
MENYSDLFEQEFQEKPINWRDVFERFVVYWKWIVASVILFFIAGYIYTRTQIDTYEFNASMLVIDQSKNGQMNEMSMLKQLDAMGIGGSTPSMVNDEQQVLCSTELMKRVVNQLELHTTYTSKHFLKQEDLYTASPLHLKTDNKILNQLDIDESIELKVIPAGDGSLSVDGRYGDQTFSREIKHLPATIQTPLGAMTLEIRSGMAFPENEIDITVSNPTVIAQELSTNALQSDIEKQVDVIQLTLTSTNIRKGKDILKTLVEVYNKDAVEQVNRSAVNTASFIDTRLKLLTGDLTNVEKDVESYKQANHMTDLNADAQVYLQQGTTYDQQRNDAEIQLHLIKYVEQFIHDPANETALIPNLGLTDVGLVAVIQKYNELVIARDRIRRSSADDNPTLKTLSQQIQTARRAIQGSIGNSRKGLQISNGDINSKYSQLKARLNQLPRQEREFLEIKRQQQVKESLYLFLLQKREEASLNMAVTVPKGRMLNAPDKATHKSPRTNIILLIFLLMGIAFPMLIIYIRDLLNSSIRDSKEVEKLTSLPVITELGHNDDDSVFIDHTSQSNTNAELFRLLRTKLQFALDYPTEKIIMVTSTEPGEGKTFVSINLALSLSLTDKKVLLIGMDLRKPQLSKYFNIAKQDGISAYLSGHESDYKSLIHPTKTYPNLDVLPAGQIPPNPNELMMKERLDKLVEELKKAYDYIVFDTAPVGAVSDTLLLNRITQATLYVCRAGYSDKRDIELVNRLHQEKNLDHLYLIVNDVNIDHRRYYYRKGYSYGYGKYYGHKKEKKDAKKFPFLKS